MVQTENECVDCGLPCIYESCPYWAVRRYYCDDCGEEEDLYWYEDEQLCIDCIAERLKRVECND